MARILIADDDENLRSTLRRLLKRAGHEVMEAPDGKVALQMHGTQQADIVITDIIMPEKEGLETIRELKHDYPATKIIAVSGGGVGTPDNYLLLAAALGADCTLTKPFSSQKLLSAIDELAHNSPADH